MAENSREILARIKVVLDAASQKDAVSAMNKLREEVLKSGSSFKDVLKEYETIVASIKRQATLIQTISKNVGIRKDRRL